MTNSKQEKLSVPNETEVMVSVWDPLVRLFHWGLVTAFIIAYVTEEDFLLIHSWAGYIILGLLFFRVAWGFIGPKHARFSDFVFTPSHILRFLKDTLMFKAKRYLGHNPAGGAMIVLLIISLLTTCITGVMVFGIEEGQGPLASALYGLGGIWGDIAEEVHEFFANFTLFLVFVHVAGVLFESFIHKENLVASMIDGKKRTDKISRKIIARR